MGNRRTPWVAAGLISWLLVSLISLMASGARSEVYLCLIVLQQLAFLVCGVRGTDWKALEKPTLRAAARGVPLGIGLYVTNALTLSAILRLLQLSGADWGLQLAAEERSLMETMLKSGRPGIAGLVFVLVAFWAPLAEEFFFRGALLGELTSRLGHRRGLVLASLVFASLHLYIIQFIPVFVAGLYLGAVALATKDIFTAAAAHAVANGLTFLALLAVL